VENPKNGLKRLLGANQLLRLLGSQSASTYANQVIAFVIPWLVLTRTGSAVSAGTVAFAMGVAGLRRCYDRWFNRGLVINQIALMKAFRPIFKSKPC